MAFNLDEKDRKILEILKDHGEYTTRQIAKKTLLPVTTIHHRIKRLKQEKVIRKYSVDIDPVILGKHFRAYILISVNLELLKQKKKTQHDLAKELRRLSFIQQVDIVSGGTDIVALIGVKDVAEFDHVLLGKLQLIEGIEKTQSLIVINGE